ncbi:MAG: hypothetical protein K1X74_09690 [Pirellulales bacterium]|nr:hypothetical protein [Pirellulales bacterium]
MTHCPFARFLSAATVAGMLFCGTSVALAQRSNPDGAAPAATSKAGSLQELLDQSAFAYKKMEDGRFRVTVESSGTVSVIIASDPSLWKDNEGNDVRTVFIFRWIADLPEGFKPSAEFLSKIHEINDARYLGRCCINKYGIYYASDFWLRTADKLSLEDEFYAAHYGAEFMAKELKPFLQSEE